MTEIGKRAGRPEWPLLGRARYSRPGQAAIRLRPVWWRGLAGSTDQQ